MCKVSLYVSVFAFFAPFKWVRFTISFHIVFMKLLYVGPLTHTEVMLSSSSIISVRNEKYMIAWIRDNIDTNRYTVDKRAKGNQVSLVSEINLSILICY